MTMHVDTIVSQLTSFDPSDLAKIKQCAELLMNNNGTIVHVDPDEQLLFDAVRSELDSRGFKVGMSYQMFSTGKNFNSWKKGVSVVEEFMAAAFSDHVKTKTERIAMFRVLIQILVRDLKRRKIPISIGTVANNLQYIQQAFDNEFPNYLEGGIAYLVPQAIFKKK
jgi:hypothetical protein